MDINVVLKKRQQDLLAYLQFVDELCRKNNIKYSISFGTLLGAVRHKGFIPWDDDLDIAMEREAFEKFQAVMEKEKNAPFTLTQELWITRLVRKDYKQEEMPMMLDFFLYDNVPEKEVIRKGKIFLLRFLQGTLKKKPDYKKYKGIQKLFVAMSYNIGKLFSYQTKFHWYQKAMQIGNKKRTKYVNHFNDDFRGLKHRIPREVIEEYDEIAFEGQYFMAHKEKEQLLTEFYGDYMQLPPKEERIPMHLMTLLK